MDHLLYPQSDSLPPLDIPFLPEAERAHEAADFPDFASHQGWFDGQGRWRTLIENYCTLDAVNVVAGYAQAWLYFELLDTFLQTNVPRETFKKPSRRRRTHDEANAQPTTPRLSSEPLPGLLDNWRAEMLALGPPQSIWRSSSKPARSGEMLKFVHQMDEYLLIAYSQAEVLDHIPSPAGCHLPPVVASIKALIGSLRTALRTPRLMLNMPDYPSFIPGASALRGRLLAAGYCPSRIEVLFSTYPTAALYYFSGLRSQDASGKPHTHCTPTSCAVVHVDMDTYRTRHADDCAVLSMYSNDPVCRHLGPDPDTLRTMIESGGIPIACLAVDRHGELQLTIRPRTSIPSYIAISHVWSDGLGNPTATTLPRCQLRRLYEQLRAVPQEPSWARAYLSDGLNPLSDIRPGWNPRPPGSSPTYFWIDTLCIPPSDKRLRQKAIGSMGEVYAGAESVLVLDAGLQTITHQSLPAYETSARIAVSAWMTRCWTYQEAVLARRMFFQFADGVFDVMTAYWTGPLTQSARLDAGRVWRDHDETALRQLFTWFDVLPTLIETDDPGGYKMREAAHVNFMNIWNALAERHTTKSGDRVLNLAVLSYMFIADMFKLKEEERLESVVAAQEYIPLTMFVTPGTYSVENYGGKILWQPPAPGGFKLTRLLGWAKISPVGFTFNPADENCLGVDGAHPRFVLVQEPIPSGTRTLQVKVEGEGTLFIHQDDSLAEPERDDESQRTCFLVEGSTGGGLSKFSRLNGAKFHVIDTNSSKLTLRLVGPITGSTHSMFEADSALRSTTSVHGTLLDPVTTVFISYGKSLPTPPKKSHPNHFNHFPAVRFTLAVACAVVWYLMLYLWTWTDTPAQLDDQAPWIDGIGLTRLVLGACEGLYRFAGRGAAERARWIASHNRWDQRDDAVGWKWKAVGRGVMVLAVVVGAVLCGVGFVVEGGNVAGWVGSSMLGEVGLRVGGEAGWERLEGSEAARESRVFLWLRENF
ncbi:hypothetical protein B0T19DRAFT_404277 [Cercophora scortea]|uniref:Heterokaryon incompatibility domain-containing protein n=1 Tax=Cercophora scortea TaxID=314031 RepID=A0AAE0I7H0_9PEZI|nr:hypothetical protein B0T19DRAFT_404277 [Cercophora scortea]